MKVRIVDDDEICSDADTLLRPEPCPACGDENCKWWKHDERTTDCLELSKHMDWEGSSETPCYIEVWGHTSEIHQPNVGWGVMGVIRYRWAKGGWISVLQLLDEKSNTRLDIELGEPSSLLEAMTLSANMAKRCAKKIIPELEALMVLTMTKFLSEGTQPTQSQV